MSEVIIAALVSAAAAIVVGLINSRAQHNKLIAELDKRDELQAYRIEQLERKVDKHNQVIARTYKLEECTELLGERIKVAREFGDISENSEYDDAKNEQGMMEARIAEITRILSEATVVSAPKRSGKVNIGSRVTVDMGGRERVFTIVGGAESNSAEGKISNESPVGKVLIGAKIGDIVEVET